MPKILIVDDEHSIRGLLKVNFSAIGWETVTAETIDEAMRILADGEHFDVVLADVRTPGAKDGHDLARWLVGKASPPFILMTGWQTECDDCPLHVKCKMLQKPFTLAQARLAVQQLLGIAE